MTAARDLSASDSGASDLALRVEQVSTGYGDLRVLHGVDLELPRGRLEVLLGRNGAGKTTLLSTIAGLLPCWSGSITHGTEEITKVATFRRSRAGIALVQEGKRIFKNRTVLQNITLGTHGTRMSRVESRAMIEGLFDTFPILRPRRSSLAGSLSGGQQQMLALAQALAARPDVLMLDEPSAGLAPVIVAELFEKISELRDEGMTVLLVEQLAQQAIRFADHVSVLNNGRIVDSGPASKFSDLRAVHDAYFGGSGSVEASDGNEQARRASQGG